VSVLTCLAFLFSGVFEQTNLLNKTFERTGQAQSLSFPADQICQENDSYKDV